VPRCGSDPASARRPGRYACAGSGSSASAPTARTVLAGDGEMLPIRFQPPGPYACTSPTDYLFWKRDSPSCLLLVPAVLVEASNSEPCPIRTGLPRLRIETGRKRICLRKLRAVGLQIIVSHARSRKAFSERRNPVCCFMYQW